MIFSHVCSSFLAGTNMVGFSHGKILTKTKIRCSEGTRTPIGARISGVEEASSIASRSNSQKLVTYYIFKSESITMSAGVRYNFFSKGCCMKSDFRRDRCLWVGDDRRVIQSMSKARF